MVVGRGHFPRRWASSRTLKIGMIGVDTGKGRARGWKRRAEWMRPGRGSPRWAPGMMKEGREEPIRATVEFEGQIACILA